MRQQGASKRTAGKAQARQTRGQRKRQQPEAAAWASSVGSLLASQTGRDILAEVLEAAAGVLRKVRQTGEQVADASSAAADAGADLATRAVEMSTDVASDVAEGGADIAAAGANMVDAAAGAMADIATAAMNTLVPEQPAGTGARKGRGGSRKRQSGSSDEPSA